MVGAENENAKTICSICFEDLKPIVEDLQSISICGHVFHELCLQQWFEYCTNGKKTCPVCKQVCNERNVCRLYFQSFGDTNEAILSQKPRDCEQNTEELRREIKRLQGKVSGLSSAVEQHQKDLNDISEELITCKEQVKIEVTQRNEALKQNATTQKLLHAKSKDLERSTSECITLQERNLSLAKELAALKLVYDLNLEEEEVLKFASLGNEHNSQETIDVLKRSLVIRNKSYKELMVKCNSLGRGEARSLSKLEKAAAKINKLKARVQELEKAVEAKENEALRTLRTSKRAFEPDSTNAFGEEPKFKRCLYEDQNKCSPEPRVDLDQANNKHTDLPCSRKVEKFKLKDSTGIVTPEDTLSYNLQDNLMFSFLKDKDIRQTSYGNEALNKNLKPITSDKAAVLDCHLSRVNASMGTISRTQVPQEVNKEESSRSSSKNKNYISPETIDDKDDLVLLDDTTLAQPSFNIRKETSLSINAEPGYRCFSGGLKGPDGTNWHLGKWCKKAQDKGSTPASQGSAAIAGDLIAVGADGRGGRIKVLRSSNPLALDNNNTSASAKRLKHGAKASSLQSKGCLQIDHFFSRAGK